jgi:hypothetical protein
MFGRKRGKWVTFDPVNPNARSVAFTTPCISTSAEMAGDFRTIIVSLPTDNSKGTTVARRTVQDAGVPATA